MGADASLCPPCCCHWSFGNSSLVISAALFKEIVDLFQCGPGGACRGIAAADQGQPLPQALLADSLRRELRGEPGTAP
jgi:hypothetical protein